MSSEFRREVADKAERMERARLRGQRFWSGLALMGSVGWVVALPMVAGIFLGFHLDKRFGGGLSFTLGLLVLGLASGLYSAWRFFLRELM